MKEKKLDWEFAKLEENFLYYKSPLSDTTICVPLPEIISNSMDAMSEEIDALRTRLSRQSEVNENKVNLLEKDIEEHLFNNPSLVDTHWGEVERWIKRQYQVPSGIIDLLGVTASGALVVAEIKNVAIDACALTQVCRYAYDLEHAIEIIRDAEEIRFPKILKIVVGRSIDDKIMREAEALNVIVKCFSVNLSLDLNGRRWSSNFIEERSRQYQQISEDRDINLVVKDYYRAVCGETEESVHIPF